RTFLEIERTERSPKRTDAVELELADVTVELELRTFLGGPPYVSFCETYGEFETCDVSLYTMPVGAVAPYSPDLVGGAIPLQREAEWIHGVSANRSQRASPPDSGSTPRQDPPRDEAHGLPYQPGRASSEASGQGAGIVRSCPAGLTPMVPSCL